MAKKVWRCAKCGKRVTEADKDARGYVNKVWCGECTLQRRAEIHADLERIFPGLRRK